MVDATASPAPATTGTSAATPSYHGQTTAAFNADTFRILKSSKHPDEAFTVLQYLLGDADELLTTLRRHAGASSRQQDAFLAEPQQATAAITADDRLERGQGGHRLRRRPELRVLHARLQRDAGPDQHVRHASGRRRPGSTSTRRSPTAQVADCRPSGTRAADSTAWRPPPASRVPAASLRGCRGLRLAAQARWGYLFIAPWIIGFFAFTLFPMVATFVFTFTNINLAQAEPLRFVGLDNYAEPRSRDQQTWDVADRHVQVRACSRCRWRSCLPFLVALMLHSPPPARLGRLPRALLPAVRRPVRRRRAHLAARCSAPDTGWINGGARGHRDRGPARLAAGPDLDLLRAS